MENTVVFHIILKCIKDSIYYFFINIAYEHTCCGFITGLVPDTYSISSVSLNNNAASGHGDTVSVPYYAVIINA